MSKRNFLFKYGHLYILTVVFFFFFFIYHFVTKSSIDKQFENEQQRKTLSQIK